MVDFLDLPVELLPLILKHLVKPQDLVNASLVNHTFNTFAVPRLYNRISVYSWHKRGKERALNAFATLANCPHLAQHVRRLEIRDFPKGIVSSEGNVQNYVMKGLQNCVNLHSCTWTRDGTLTSDILCALSCSSSLREFEFNGHSQGQYDPQILSRFRSLTKISLIMPGRVVISQLCLMLGSSGHILRHLSVICKASTVLNNHILESLAPSLVNLEHLSLTGCPKVTEQGIMAILDVNQAGLKVLSLEGVSPKFDMTVFAQHCVHKHLLESLRSITLTVSRYIVDPDPWTKAVLTLLSSSPLERFQIYATSMTSDAPHVNESTSLLSAIPQFILDLVSQHGDQLKRFSIHRMPLGIRSVVDICTHCPNVEELFLVVEPRLLNSLPDVLRQAKKLRTVHINYPLEVRPGGSDDNEAEDPRPVLTPAQTWNFVRRCGPSLVQFGCNTKVWQIGRAIQLNDGGEKVAEPCILPYESPDIPEQFLVVRT